MLHISSTALQTLWLCPTIQRNTKGRIVMSSYHPLTSGKICGKEVWNENFRTQDTLCPLVIIQCSLKKLRSSLTLMQQDQIHYTAAVIANILSSFQNIIDFSALCVFFLFATSTAGKFATNNLLYLKSTNFRFRK